MKRPTDMRHPVFTVGSALRWLGHDCPGRQCWLPIDALSASMWFLLRGQGFYAFPPSARVLIDLPIAADGLARMHEVIYDVILCPHRDAIEVGYRRSRAANRFRR